VIVLGRRFKLKLGDGLRPWGEAGIGGRQYSEKAKINDSDPIGSTSLVLGALAVEVEEEGAGDE